MRAADFYLSSGEHVGEWARARAAYVERVLHDDAGVTHLLISVDPVVEHDGRTLPRLVIAPHFEGWSIWPPTRYPCPVYVYTRKAAMLSDFDTFDRAAFELTAWYEMYETMADAERVAEERDT